MPDIRSEPKNSIPRTLASDKALVWFGLIALSALAVTLWSQAGLDVFASAMAGLWALCF
ncbi:MAG: hypothetical protein J0L51_03385 [Rhizobiales bacterium]|nr:hypothetical protein [Hyphomicrobiales bacterium]